MEKKIFIRADASANIGTGHVMRCIALAQKWAELGGEVTFLTKCENEMLVRRLKTEGVKLIQLPTVELGTNEDLGFTLSCLSKEQTKPIVILDGYHFDSNFQLEIKKAGYISMVIDDYNHLPYYNANILLNQNIYAPDLNYLCDSSTIKLLGCKYAMLRREFLKQAKNEKYIPPIAKNILITMGGADPKNVTSKILDIFYNLNIPDLHIKVLIGSANKFLPDIKRRTQKINHDISISYSPPAQEIPKIFKWADIAITAGGSTCWELAYMGVPCIVITIAENQKRIGKWLERNGVAIDMGWYASLNTSLLSEILIELINNRLKRSLMSKAGYLLVDGKGVDRICDNLNTLKNI